jgi:hypothetical protein
MKQLRTLKLFQIFRTKIKNSKTYSGLCPFQGLSNGTTLMQIQSGRTVPLRQSTASISYLSVSAKKTQKLLACISALRRS